MIYEENLQLYVKFYIYHEFWNVVKIEKPYFIVIKENIFWKNLQLNHSF